VAISQDDQARAFRQAMGMVHYARSQPRTYVRSQDPLYVGNIARQLYDNNRTVPGANFAAYQAVARRALASEILVGDMTRSPLHAPGPSTLPVSPTLSVHPERYRYSVVVTSLDVRGMSVTIPGEVRSDVPLSLRDIEDRIAQSIDYRTSERPADRTALANLGPLAAPPTVALVAAFRTR